MAWRRDDTSKLGMALPLDDTQKKKKPRTLADPGGFSVRGAALF